MNREIKFRGISVKLKKFVTGSLIINPENEYPLIADIYSEYDDGRKVDVWREIDILPDTVGEFTGLKDKNGVEIYYGGDLLRIKGYMGDGREYEFDAIYKTDQESFAGLSLSFVRLFNSEPDSIKNSLPICLHPSFSNGTLDYYDDNKIVLKATRGENRTFHQTWQEHHRTVDIEVIGNIHQNHELP